MVKKCVRQRVLCPSPTSYALRASPGKYVRLTVWEKGHGMEREIMERVIDPRFTTKEVGEGSGMGLAVIPGVKGKAEIEKKTSQPIPKGSEQVLFVDDEESLVFTVKYKLQKLGYKVVAKQNPVNALELFNKEPDRFDLVITDMVMPEMTGDVLTEEVMKIRPDIPVILCTGFSENISEERAEALGVEAYVLKPVSTNEMAKTIRKVLDEKKRRIQTTDDRRQETGNR